MELILFDPPQRGNLYPFTEIRSLADLRTGLLTQLERWGRLLQMPVHVLTAPWLQKKYLLQPGNDNLYLHAGAIPGTRLIQQLRALPQGTALLNTDGTMVAYRGAATESPWQLPAPVPQHTTDETIRLLQNTHQLVHWNATALQADFGLITKGRASEPLSPTNQVQGAHQVFLEPGVKTEYCIFNTTDGPVYLGRNTVLLEGCMIRGPFGLLEGAVLKMGARIYQGCTFGRFTTVGGEVKNSLLFDFANKAHDGYLGDAVVGSWCNLGAGTSCSNVKNNAGTVCTWNPYLKSWVAAGQKCGAFIGDYSRTAIHTALNTGTVAGICCNIVGSGFVPKFIPDFTWNASNGERYVADKMIRDASSWMQFKNQELTATEKEILLHLHGKQTENI